MSRSALDRTLRRTVGHPALDGFRDDLLFVQDAVGTHSLLLGDALNAGTDACMLTPDGSTFTTYRVVIGRPTAAAFLADLNVDEGTAATSATPWPTPWTSTCRCASPPAGAPDRSRTGGRPPRPFATADD